MKARAITKELGASLLHRSGTLRRGSRRVNSDVVIVCYHGVSERPLAVSDPCFLTAAAFEEQIRYLARYFDVRHLEDAFDPARAAADRSVACITFDDGFAGLADQAIPMLERMGLPATVFLVTDLLGTSQAPWFALVHDAISRTDLETVELFAERHDLSSPAARARASVDILATLKTVRGELLEQLTRGVVATLVGDDIDVSDDFLLLSPDEVVTVARSGTIRFGAHTATHPILTNLSPSHAECEIVRSVDAVRRLVDTPSTAFAYPNGQPSDFDEQTVATLAGCGITMGLTTVPGANSPEANPYYLRRHVVTTDLSLARFAMKVHDVRGQHANVGPPAGARPLAALPAFRSGLRVGTR